MEALRKRVREIIKKESKHGSALLGEGKRSRSKSRHSKRGHGLIYPQEDIYMGGRRMSHRSKSRSRKSAGKRHSMHSKRGHGLIYPNEEYMGGRRMSHRSKSRSRKGSAMVAGKKRRMHGKALNPALGQYRKMLDQVKNSHPHLSYHEQQKLAAEKYHGKGRHSQHSRRSSRHH